MESAGVYWKPVYAVLEEALELVAANGQHVKKVPGRKTDVKDAEWLADLLCHGLLRSSFVPPKPIRELRDLMGILAKAIRGFLEGDHQFCYSDQKSEWSDAGGWDSAISDRNGQEKNVESEYFFECDHLFYDCRST